MKRPYLLLAALSIGPALLAQTVRVNIPGTAFSAEGLGRQQVSFVDVGGGVRRFHGPQNTDVTLRAAFPAPPAGAEPKMQRLVVHFRTNAEGATLLSVDVSGPGGPLHFDVDRRGDFTKAETIGANARDWGKSPVAVNAQSVVRLQVRFPSGLDTGVDPKEPFFLIAVAIDYPQKPIVRPDTTTAQSPSSSRVQSSIPSPAAGVIYAINSTGDLLWYRHDGRQGGSSQWAGQSGKKVGEGWTFKQVFSGGDGVIYAVTSDNRLLWFRHDGVNDGVDDGTFQWPASAGKNVGTGWSFEHVFSAGNGVIYAITADGDLLWYRHEGRRDGSSRWAGQSGKKVGEGWTFKQVFSGGDGVIYAVTSDNQLLWFRHDGVDDGTFQWPASAGKKVGDGWNFEHVFSGGGGVLYGVTAAGDLLWYRHAGRADGSYSWTPPSGKAVGSGWKFVEVF